MTTYDIAAIPTRYNGVNFRSRLEARWAAFFDLCGWTWEYEPFDLRGWIPDFRLEGRLLVEIKPIDMGEPFELKLLGDLAKCRVAPDRSEVLILGLAPFGVDETGAYEADDGTTASIGALVEIGGDFLSDRALIKHSPDGSLDIGGDGISWHGRLGKSEPKAPTISVARMVELWRQAGNAVQWSPRS